LLFPVSAVEGFKYFKKSGIDCMTGVAERDWGSWELGGAQCAIQPPENAPGQHWQSLEAHNSQRVRESSEKSPGELRGMQVTRRNTHVHVANDLFSIFEVGRIVGFRIGQERNNVRY